MAFLERKSCVSYRCNCGRYKPLPRIYFCRHCFLLRCEFCVSHEIDSRHCTSCLENQPITDAWNKGNRCSNCLLCPMCHSNLSTRIFNAKPKQDPDGEAKAAVPIKSYYLSCMFCRWTSRDIGLEDSTSPATKWPELENPNTAVVNELVEYYKAVSINDRLERERKTHGNRRAYSHISGLSATIARQKAGLPFRSTDTFQEPSKLKVTKGIPKEPEDDLPEDIYTNPPDLTKISNLRQRHRLPEGQPEQPSKLCYTRKILIAKQSSRCRSCEHNVIKPEFIPTNTKFKIQLSAYYLVPEVRIKTVEPLRAGQKSQLLLLIINPTQHATTITFRSFEDESSDTKADSVSVQVYKLKSLPNAAVEFPTEAIPLAGRDDVAEFDEPSDTPAYNDNPNIVSWRKGNRILVKMSVLPDESLMPGSKVTAGLTLMHIYTSTVIQQQDKKQPGKIDHAFKLLFDLGTCVSSS